MKTKIIPISLILVFLYSCEDTTYKEYKGNAPVYMSYDALRGAVSTTDTAVLRNPGKMYFKDNYIFIIEELKGIHVFDNTNPAAPVKKTFVILPGVIDMAIAGNILYADSYMDLVALDVQDVNNITEAGRIPDVLPYTMPPTGNTLPIEYIDREKGVVIKWEVKKIKEKVYPNPPIIYPYYKTFEGMNFATADGASSSGVSSGGVGVGGSMARFGIKNDYLYLLDNNKLTIFDIHVKKSPARVTETWCGSGIETMFIAGNYMYLGTTTGMIIYDISNPTSLVRKSTYNHVRSCDPVIVDDTLAYVTLRTGNRCGGTVNLLDVVNIKNVSIPMLVSSYPMNNPHGLGKNGNLLFICDGSSGLKIYDASDSRAISSHLIYTYPGIQAYDVIPIGNILILIGDNGLYQYDYSSINNIKLLSTISIGE